MAEKKEVQIQDDPFSLFNKIEAVGKIEQVIKLTDDINLIISTLNTEEEGEVFSDIAEYEGIEYITMNKIEVLAHAIRGINDKKFDYDKIEDPKVRREERKKAVVMLKEKIKTWRDEVVSFLYDEWLKLTGNSEEQLKKIGIYARIETKKKLDEIQSELDKEAKDNLKETENENETEQNA